MQTTSVILATCCVISGIMIGPVFLIVRQARRIERQTAELKSMLVESIKAKAELKSLIIAISECQHDKSCPARRNEIYCAGYTPNS